jgi:hypothetical protein
MAFQVDGKVIEFIPTRFVTLSLSLFQFQPVSLSLSTHRHTRTHTSTGFLSLSSTIRVNCVSIDDTMWRSRPGACVYLTHAHANTVVSLWSVTAVFVDAVDYCCSHGTERNTNTDTHHTSSATSHKQFYTRVYVRFECSQQRDPTSTTCSVYDSTMKEDERRKKREGLIQFGIFRNVQKKLETCLSPGSDRSSVATRRSRDSTLE